MESLLIAAQNNTIKTKYVKTKIDKTQENSNRLCGDRDKTINHIISECSKKSTRLDTTGGGKAIHWELCKKLKFDPLTKIYMHNP